MQEHDLTPQQLLEAQQALDVAAFNGILSLAIVLRKRNLLSDQETGRLHDIMSRPLSMPGNADNRLSRTLSKILISSSPSSSGVADPSRALAL